MQRAILRLAIAAFAMLAICAGGPQAAWADEQSAKLHAKIEKLLAEYRQVDKNPKLSPEERERKKRELFGAIMDIRNTLIYRHGEDADQLQAKIQRLKSPKAAEAEPEPNYTNEEKARVEELTRTIKTKQDQLANIKDKTSSVAKILTRQIERHEKELAEIRKQALARPAPPKAVVPPVPFEQVLLDALDGKVDGEQIKGKRPWKVGDWQDRFADPKDFARLRDEYYRLQDALQATLLIKRKTWTADDALKHAGQLSTLSARLKFIEGQFMIELARLSPGSPIGKKLARLKQEWEALLVQEKAIIAELKEIERQIKEIMKKHKLKPGQGGASNDWAIREINRLVDKHRRIQKERLLPKMREVNEKQNERAAAQREAEAEIQGKAEAYLKLVKGSFKIHIELGGPQSSTAYQDFLSPSELGDFYRETGKQRAAIRKARQKAREEQRGTIRKANKNERAKERPIGSVDRQETGQVDAQSSEDTSVDFPGAPLTLEQEMFISSTREKYPDFYKWLRRQPGMRKPIGKMNQADFQRFRAAFAKWFDTRGAFPYGSKQAIQGVEFAIYLWLLMRDGGGGDGGDGGD